MSREKESRPVRYQLTRRHADHAYANRSNPHASYHGFVPFVNGGFQHG